MVLNCKKQNNMVNSSQYVSLLFLFHHGSSKCNSALIIPVISTYTTIPENISEFKRDNKMIFFIPVSILFVYLHD